MSVADPRETGVYDWNRVEDWSFAGRNAPAVHDETLRDGLQSPSIVDPPLAVKAELLELLAAMGVGSANVGLPGAGPRAFSDSLALCRQIVERKLEVEPCCAGRTVIRDLEPIVEIAQRTGRPVEAMIFVGSSPIRHYVEGWSLDFVLRCTREAVGFAVREGLPVTYVTEDTTRTPPRILWPMFRAAIDAGASRLCLCDTVGHATPDGASHLVRWTRTLIASTGATIGIDWHGHADRGFALANTLSACAAGADRLHGCVLGIGERVGNASVELLLMNLVKEGLVGEGAPTEEALRAAATRACRLVAEGMRAPIPADHFAARAHSSE